MLWKIDGTSLVRFEEWTIANVKNHASKMALDVVELWSGAGHIAGEARELGHASVEFDYARTPGHTNVAGPMTGNITTK